MDAIKPDFIVICADSGFLLPVFKKALTRTKKSVNFIKDRYEGALVVDIKSSDVSQITNIIFPEVSFLNKILHSINFQFKDIHCQHEKVECHHSDLLSIISTVAISKNSYPVWGQFYDSAEDLNNLIMQCKNIDELLNVLHINGVDSISDELV